MLSRLALGTVQFGLPYGIANQNGQVSYDNLKAILSFASCAGIDTLDTAISYGDSEACLGELGIKEFKIITKLPSIPDNTADVNRWIYDQILASLERLGVQSIYGLLLHRSQQLLEPNGKVIVQALEQLKSEGVVKKIGASIYSPSELNQVTQVCSIDLIQAPFSIIDRRLLTSGWLQKLHEADVEVHARSAFLQGLLLMPRTAIPEKFHKWSYIWDIWHRWLDCNNAPAVKACIGFVQRFPQIDRVVVGVDNVRQLTEILGAERSQLDASLPDISSTDEMLINPSCWGST